MIAAVPVPWDATPRMRHRLLLALALSVVLHATAWHWARWPEVTIDLPEPALAVAIVEKPAAPPPAPPLMAPVETVAPPKPEPVQPLPAVRKATAPRVAPAPAAAPPSAPPASDAPLREPVLVAKPETPPSVEVAVPPPPPPPIARAVDPQAPSPDAVAGYGRSVSQALARHREYPRLAMMRGWEGATTLRLRVAPGGKLTEASVHQSSGHEVLDDQALAMVRRLGSLPLPPDSLRDREFAVLVPVVFQLAR
jgi:protein TonB